MIGFSFCLCTHNEGSEYILKCVENIFAALDEIDEVIIVDDYSTDNSTIKCLDSIKDKCQLFYHSLNGNFAEHKNFLISKCNKEYIFLFDADEYINAENIRRIKDTVKEFSVYDAWYLPRKNILLNTDEATIKKMNWNVKDGLFNYPDYQLRIWKNRKGIHYVGKLHEQVHGYKSCQKFPTDLDYDIMHIKTQDRQLKQHYFYENMK